MCFWRCKLWSATLGQNWADLEGFTNSPLNVSPVPDGSTQPVTPVGCERTHPRFGGTEVLGVGIHTIDRKDAALRACHLSIGCMDLLQFFVTFHEPWISLPDRSLDGLGLTSLPTGFTTPNSGILS